MKRGRAQIHANLTPMIDVTFLLIVFFVLVSQIVEVENVEMVVPELFEPSTELAGEEQRAVINVVPGPSGVANGYRLAGRDYAAGDEGLALLTEDIGALLAGNPQMRVNLRADQQTHYVYVQPVLQAVSDAAGRSGHEGLTPRVNLVVVREDE